MTLLTSMTDFVLNVGRPHTTLDFHEMDYYHKEYECIEKITNYANFLNQPLTLGMFVPCDEDGNVLEEPRGWLDENCTTSDCCNICKCDQYQQAKERVLFEGFYVEYNAIRSPDGGYLDKSIANGTRTIEVIIGSNLTLTQSAIKQLGL